MLGRLSSFAALSIAARTRVSKRPDVMTPDPAMAGGAVRRSRVINCLLPSCIPRLIYRWLGRLNLAHSKKQPEKPAIHAPKTI